MVLVGELSGITESLCLPVSNDRKFRIELKQFLINKVTARFLLCAHRRRHCKRCVGALIWLKPKITSSMWDIHQERRLFAAENLERLDSCCAAARKITGAYGRQDQ